MCIHSSSIPKEYCSICNGDEEAKEQKRLEKKNNTKTKLRKKLQFLSVQQAERNDFPVEDWEIDYFLDNVPNKGDRYNILSLYEIALYLQRTLNAMTWWALLSKDEKFQQKVFANPKECHSRAFILRFQQRENNVKESQYEPIRN